MLTLLKKIGAFFTEIEINNKIYNIREDLSHGIDEAHGQPEKLLPVFQLANLEWKRLIQRYGYRDKFIKRAAWAAQREGALFQYSINPVNPDYAKAAHAYELEYQILIQHTEVNAFAAGKAARNRGLCLMELTPPDYKNAITAFEQSCEQFNHTLGSWVKIAPAIELGQALIHQPSPDYLKAAEVFANAAKRFTDLKSANAWRYAGDCYTHLLPNFYEQAMDAYKQAHKIYKENNFYKLQKETLIKKYLLKLKGLPPIEAISPQTVNYILYGIKELIKENDYWLIAYKIDKVYSLLGRAYAKQNQYPLAEKYFDLAEDYLNRATMTEPIKKLRGLQNTLIKISSLPQARFTYKPPTSPITIEDLSDSKQKRLEKTQREIKAVCNHPKLLFFKRLQRDALTEGKMSDMVIRHRI